MRYAEQIIERDKKIISPSLTRELPFVFDHGKDCFAWDADGKRYLDFTASVAVNGIGHCNPGVQNAIQTQMKKGIHCGFSDSYAEEPVSFAEKLISFMPGYQKVFLSNSGTESVEAAYKLARWYNKKRWTIAFEGCFHGRTMGSLSITNSKPIQRQGFEPFLPVIHVPYPYSYKMKIDLEKCSDYCLNKLKVAIRSKKGKVAAVFLEPILGEGGYVVPSKSFVQGVRELCNDHDILLCLDEVQSGCFRTGKFLAQEHFGIKADIICLSKAIGGGLPLGATVARNGLMSWPKGSHANTLGGNLLACAAGIAVLDFMKKKNLGQNAARIGKIMLRRLNELKGEDIVDVRGIGLMIGVEIKNQKRRNEILVSAFRKGLLLLPAGDAVIRICPPLTLSRENAEKGIDVLRVCLNY